ncbi:hypothetical protein Tco_0132211 [Tanacetum coccineum]
MQTICYDAFVTNLQKTVSDLEKAKVAQAKDIADLNERVRSGMEKEIKTYKIKKTKESIEDDKETDEHKEVDEAELKKHLVIVKDDDIAIDAIPLATKPPMIVEYKLLK